MAGPLQESELHPLLGAPGRRKGQGGRLSCLSGSVGGSALASLTRDAGVATPAPSPSRDQIYRGAPRRKRISATISDAFQPPIHQPLLLQPACKTRGPFAKKKKKNTAWKSLHRVRTKPKLSEWILWFVFTLTDFSLWSCASRSAAERFKGKVLRL